eukprot:jgi/Tetstr1/430755/TSEL_020540.t1
MDNLEEIIGGTKYGFYLETETSTEWTEELKESLMEFADIIAEPTDLPPEREFDFEINLESDEPPRNERQIKMDPRKVEAVQQWPVPKTVKDVRGFLGLAGYYRKFINNFAAIAAPLHDLTKNQPEFVWTPRADAAFRALKDAMWELCFCKIKAQDFDMSRTMHAR